MTRTTLPKTTFIALSAAAHGTIRAFRSQPYAPWHFEGTVPGENGTRKVRISAATISRLTLHRLLGVKGAPPSIGATHYELTITDAGLARLAEHHAHDKAEHGGG